MLLSACCYLQDPEATSFLECGASTDTISGAISALRPVQSSGMLAEVKRTGPFGGGGYRWSIAFRAETATDDAGFASFSATFPRIGVQQANVTGTGVRVKVEQRREYEAAAEQVLSLAAPLPPETAEVQMLGCYLSGLTPSEAATAGISFAIAFRGETTEVSC